MAMSDIDKKEIAALLRAEVKKVVSEEAESLIAKRAAGLDIRSIGVPIAAPGFDPRLFPGGVGGLAASGDDCCNGTCD